MGGQARWRGGGGHKLGLLGGGLARRSKARSRPLHLGGPVDGYVQNSSGLSHNRRSKEEYKPMARVPYVGADSPGQDPTLADLYASIADLRGSVHNLHRALANQPAALRAFMGMSRYVRDDSRLDPKLRELAILATGHALDVAYEKHHHIRAARRVGLPEEKINAFPRWWESSLFDETERTVLTYADQVARRRDVDDATFAALRTRFDDGAIVDLAMTVGWYHLSAAIL